MVVFLWFVVGIILCFVSASLAKTKHRSVAGWIILTLVTSFIATIILALLPAVGSDEVVAGISKKCPKCAEIIKSEAKICRFCGYNFEAKQ